MPENSRAAIDAAFKLGVSLIETDLQYSKDGKIVINHDASFQGYNISSTNYVGGLDALKLSNGETLPLLDDLLDIMATSPNDTTRLFLEIKDTKAIVPAVFMVFSRGLEDRCGWTSFSDATNQTIRELYAGYGKTPYVNLTVYSVPDYTKISPSSTQSLGFYKTISFDAMHDAVARGYEVNYWIIDTESEMLQYMEEKSQIFTTNYSRRLIDLKKRLKEEQQVK